MFKRELETELKGLAKDYPIVTVIGPRQSGKTTIVQHAFPEKKYANLEFPDIRAMAIKDPRGFLEQFSEGAILDEIQRAPELLSYIQPIVDEKNKKGMFILTGSHQIELQEAISQSLAGRTALLTLLPLNLAELISSGFDLTVDEWILKGGYPRIYKDRLDPTKAYRNYFQTYVERDLRQLIQVKDLMQFERFVQILAGRIGQIVNMEEIGGEVGISSHTVKQWISIMEASFIVFRLPPYFENFGKRVIKSPKLYFNDVGLAAYLLGIQNEIQLRRDPLRGNLFENAIILELKKYRLNRGLDPFLFYYRDVQKNEIDVIYKKGHDLIPIEIKSSKTYHSEFIEKLRYFQSISKERAPQGFLIYAGEAEQRIKNIHVLNFKHATQSIY
ncbi:MAG: ATP-binding protein [Parachlamydiales bacterium]|nr:ATP-binding protein [Parachlamydiales bacterium]